MYEWNQINDEKVVFGYFFYITGKLDTYLDRALNKWGITSKQWFMLVVLESMFDQPPTIKEVADHLGTTHQNVKQLGLKLQEKGLIRIEKDVQDKRALRLITTEKNKDMGMLMQVEGDAFVSEVFNNISSDELNVMRKVMSKIAGNLLEINDKRGGK